VKAADYSQTVDEAVEATGPTPERTEGGRAIPLRVYDSLTADHRLLTVSRPLAAIALSRGVRQLRAKASPKGVERLDGIFVINLERRSDRLRQFQSGMRRLEIVEHTRFPAIEHEIGILGCNRSHAACLRAVVDNGSSCVMICEDDAEFVVTREELDVLVEAFLEDRRAEVACLAYHHLRPPTRHNMLYLRAPEDTRTAACYLVKRSIAAELAAVFEEGAKGLANGGDRMVYSLDTVWSGLQRSRVFLIPIKRAARQTAGYSDIEGAFVDYGGL
jgi:hypothetical protein